jgi:Uma2 family endonuclease
MTILEQMVAGEAPSIVPLTVEQYHKMIAQEILHEGGSIELIDGILVRKDRGDKGGDPMSHGPRHSSAVVALQENLDGVKPAGCHLRVQLPVTIGGIQEPEPDVGVIRGKRQEIINRHPGPADIVALMEVSDSSLTFDRTTKQRLYAIAVIPIYWIVNLVDQQIEVYTDPQPSEGKYACRTDYLPGQSVTLAIGPGVEIAVAVSDVLPA